MVRLEPILIPGRRRRQGTTSFNLDLKGNRNAQNSHVPYKAKPPPGRTGVCRWMAGGERLGSVSRQGPACGTSFSLVNHGTYTADLGYTGAASSYIDTQYDPGAGTNFVTASASAWIWTTANFSSGTDYGSAMDNSNASLSTRIFRQPTIGITHRRGHRAARGLPWR
jgi:hypothetical protein